METYHILLSSITTIIFTTLKYINKKEEPQETFFSFLSVTTHKYSNLYPILPVLISNGLPRILHESHIQKWCPFDSDDLGNILEELKNFVPGTTISIARPYRARFTTQNRENLINSIKFAVITYVITFFAALAIIYKYPLTTKPEEIELPSVIFNALLTSVPPTVIVFFSKKVERLSELIF